jgi:hypothetical protein
MAGRQDNKLDIIRLKRDGEGKSAAPVRRRPQVHKLSSVCCLALTSISEARSGIAGTFRR